MSDKYNRSENAVRSFEIVRRGGYTGLGRRWIDIRCPFCGSISRAFIWSLAGGGKKCISRECGALHGHYGITIPVIGREHMEPVLSRLTSDEGRG